MISYKGWRQALVLNFRTVLLLLRELRYLWPDYYNIELQRAVFLDYLAQAGQTHLNSEQICSF